MRSKYTRVISAAALIVVGYLAGSVMPIAQASDGMADVVRQLGGIHSELTMMRRLMERGR